MKTSYLIFFMSVLFSVVQTMLLSNWLDHLNLEKQLSLLLLQHRSDADTKNLTDLFNFQHSQISRCSSVSFTQRMSYYSRTHYANTKMANDALYDQLTFHLTLVANLSDNEDLLLGMYPVSQISDVFAVRYDYHSSPLMDEPLSEVCYAPPQAYVKNPNASSFYTLTDLERLRSPLNWSRVIHDLDVCFSDYPVNSQNFPPTLNPS
jgi:hypothetical protein